MALTRFDEAAVVVELTTLGNLVYALVHDIRELPPAEGSVPRLLRAHRRACEQLDRLVPAPLPDAFGRLRLPLEPTTTDAARIATAQALLVGWLQGVFQGVRVAVALCQEPAAD